MILPDRITPFEQFLRRARDLDKRADYVAQNARVNLKRRFGLTGARMLMGRHELQQGMADTANGYRWYAGLIGVRGHVQTPPIEVAESPYEALVGRRFVIGERHELLDKSWRNPVVSVVYVREVVNARDILKFETGRDIAIADRPLRHQGYGGDRSGWQAMSLPHSQHRLGYVDNFHAIVNSLALSEGVFGLLPPANTDVPPFQHQA